MRRRSSVAIVLFLPLLLASPAKAAVYSDALGKCLVNASSDADKALLVRWIFAGLTLNPAVANLSAVTDDQREAISRDAGQMFERLMTVSCRKEASEAIRYEGAFAVQSAFQLLGQVAGAALMRNPAVAGGIGNIFRYVDEEKFRQLANDDK